jgi:hypothetical protein
VPAGSVEDQDGVRAGIDGAADLGQMRVHGRRGAAGQDDAGALALLGADRPEDVGGSRALILRGCGPAALACPAPRRRVLLADAGLVLPPEFERRVGWQLGADRSQAGGKVFLNAVKASRACW